MPRKKFFSAPVSTRALVQRVNRKLVPEGRRLKKPRTARGRSDLGEFFIVDVSLGAIVQANVDPEALARGLGALQPWEKVAKEE
jgi:hypothetical protein